MSARLLLIGCVALVGACGGQAGPAGQSPTASPTLNSAAPLATSSPAAESSPSPSANPDVLACRLPVVVGNQGGWVTFPSGDFKPDPKSDVRVPFAVPLGKTYDKAVERWVPVPRDWISPDGKKYAYPESPTSAAPSGGVHVVDITSGADRLLNPGQPLPSDGFWWVMDWEAEGIYVAVQPNGPALPSGLWLLDPSNGSTRTIDSRTWQYVSRLGAWGTADALTGHGPGPGSRLNRLDLKTGAVESWYKRNDIEFLIPGADGAGHPVLTAYKSGVSQLILVTAPNSGVVIQPLAGTAIPQLSNFVRPLEDSHGIWFGDVAGTVSLYRPGVGLKVMARIADGQVGIAGGCR